MPIPRRAPMQSKKFIAFLLTQLILAGTMITSLVLEDFSVAMSIFMDIGVMSMGALAIGYIISERALDQFLHTVQDIVDKDEEEDNNAGEA